MAEGIGPVLLAATAVSMRARVGGLTRRDIDVMLNRALELLETGDTLRDAIIVFSAQYEQLHRDPDAVVSLGDELQRGIDRALRPEPYDLSRRDIHG